MALDLDNDACPSLELGNFRPCTCSSKVKEIHTFSPTNRSNIYCVLIEHLSRLRTGLRKRSFYAGIPSFY